MPNILKRFILWGLIKLYVFIKTVCQLTNCSVVSSYYNRCIIYIVPPFVDETINDLF